MIHLSDTERDAIGEAFNLGVGSAGNALSEMLGKEVLLSVPAVDISLREDAAKTLTPEDPNEGVISGVREAFEGPFSGDAFLLFTENRSLELVRLLLQQPDADIDMLSEMEQEALVEVGNIILNACLAQIADIMGTEIFNDIPIAIKGQFHQIIDDATSADQKSYVMKLHMHFAVEGTQIDGNIAFVMGIQSLGNFKKHICEYFGLEAA